MATRGTPTTGEFNVREDIRRKFMKKDLTKSEWEALKAAHQLEAFLGRDSLVTGINAGKIQHQGWDGQHRWIEVFLEGDQVLIVDLDFDGEREKHWHAWKITDMSDAMHPQTYAVSNARFLRPDGTTDNGYRFVGPFVGYVGADLSRQEVSQMVIDGRFTVDYKACLVSA